MTQALKDLDAPRELNRIYRGRAVYAFSQLRVGGCRAVKADGGFYVVLDCTERLKADGAEDSIALARDLVAEAGLATVPGTDFGAPRTLRLSLCSARFEEAIDRLADYLRVDTPLQRSRA
jgi:aspartate aminotransferase